MPSYTSGLNFTSPDKGDTDWDVTEATKDLKLSAHDHTGGGKGLAIATAALATNAVTGAKIRLANNEALRALNAAGSADVNIVKVDTGNRVEFPTVARFTSTETLTSSGAVSVATSLTILNGSSLAMTLADGVEGQQKWIVNIASTVATVTPATTSGYNTARINQYGQAEYTFISGEWRLSPASGALSDVYSETLTSSGAVALTTTLTILNGSSLAMTLANGFEGQVKYIVNINATNATVTPATAAGDNTATLYQHGMVTYVYMSGEWRLSLGRRSHAANAGSGETLTSSGAVSTIKVYTILNGSSLAMTLADGVEGQWKYIVNIASTTATVTPATASGDNVVKLFQHGMAHYVFFSGEWRLVLAVRAVASSASETLTSNGAISVVKDFTILNGSTLAMTLADGVEGQRKYIVNINATTATVTPATAAGDNVAKLLQHGAAHYMFMSGEWRLIQGTRCVATTGAVETLTSSGAISVVKSMTILNGSTLAMTLADGVEHQQKYVVNIASTTATVTPATAAGNNVVKLLQYGAAHYVFFSGEWRLVQGTRCIATTGDVETLTSSGAVSVVKTYTILNGASLAMTLADGVEQQHKYILNIASTAATVTPSLINGIAKVTLSQYGMAHYVFFNSEWRLIMATNAYINALSFSGADTWAANSPSVICTGTTYTITTSNGVSGQTVLVENNASGNVTFGGQVMATGTYYLYAWMNGGWRRAQLT
jgi:hypothetical protein